MGSLCNRFMASSKILGEEADKAAAAAAEKEKERERENEGNKEQDN